MKRILSVLLCVTLLFVLVGCAGQSADPQNNATNSSSSKKDEPKVFKLRSAKYVAKFDDENTVVICWGDSITQGMAMPMGFTYPQHLQGQIGSPYRVINAGVPGETCEAILSRANAIEFCLTNDVTFKKGEKQVALDRTLFKSVGAENPITYKGFGNQLKLSSVIIDGKKYTIEYEKGESYDAGTYKLTRENTASALTLKAGTKVKYDYSSQYKKVHCNVILMGANDGSSDAKSLIEKYKKLTDLNENYIVIIPFYSEDFSEEFIEAFGDKALNARDYFMNQAHKDYDIELTDTDKTCIKRGLIPNTYTYKGNMGDCHLNEKGYLILGELVYKKGQELGYWK